MSADSFDHERAAGLLPWLANGTLQGEERERVERHVRDCLTCRVELAEQTALRTMVQRQPVVPLSADAGFARLRARLDRDTRRRRSGARRAAWALAATAVIAGIGWMIVVGTRDPVSPQPGEFGTLARPMGYAAHVDVIFAADVREAALRALLEEIDGEIVAGPSENLGRYTVRVPVETDAALDRLVQHLLDDQRVRFAAPAFAPP